MEKKIYEQIIEYIKKEQKEFQTINIVLNFNQNLHKIIKQ